MRCNRERPPLLARSARLRRFLDDRDDRRCRSQLQVLDRLYRVRLRMTKYQLKDQELQKKLDEISGGGFTEALMSVKKPSCLVFQARNGGPAMSIMLTDQDIELFWEYNPDDWNIYPEVKPPEGVLMRVETEGGRKFCGY